MSSIRIRRTPLVVGGVALALGIGGGAVALQSGASAAARPTSHPLVSASVGAKTGHAGWQGAATYTPTAGTNIFVHYPCPSGRLATNGGYTVNGGSTPAVTDDSARSDISPPYTEWGWTFIWPSGAPSGTTLTLNVYCK